MEEAEALCDRLGIFIGGKLASIGSTADLKARYGKGFKLTLTTPPEKLDGLMELIRETIPDAEPINEPLAGTVSYAVAKESISIGRLFAFVEKNKKKFKILDWGISNTTLEEIFLRIVDEQDAFQDKKIKRIE